MSVTSLSALINSISMNLVCYRYILTITCAFLLKMIMDMRKEMKFNAKKLCIFEMETKRKIEDLQLISKMQMKELIETLEKRLLKCEMTIQFQSSELEIFNRQITILNKFPCYLTLQYPLTTKTTYLYDISIEKIDIGINYYHPDTDCIIDIFQHDGTVNPYKMLEFLYGLKQVRFFDLNYKKHVYNNNTENITLDIILQKLKKNDIVLDVLQIDGIIKEHMKNVLKSFTNYRVLKMFSFFPDLQDHCDENDIELIFCE